MIERKQALEALMAKVEAGDDAGFRRANRAVFSTPCQDMALQLREEHCRHAYKGSLDAAKALHEAVLPGRDWFLTNQGCHAGELPGPLAAIHNGEAEPIDGSDENPARAWLISIIRALIQEA